MRNIICLFLWIGLFSSNVLARGYYIPPEEGKDHEQDQWPEQSKWRKEEGEKQIEEVTVLPNETLLEILKYLKPKHKKEFNLINHYAYWLLNSSTNKLVLTQPENGQMTNENWKEWFSQLANLRELDLYQCQELTRTHLETIISFLNRLKRIELPENATDEYVEGLSKLTSLKELVLYNCKNIKGSAFFCLSSLSNLSFVDLGNCNKVKLVGMSLWPHLKELRCSGNGIITTQLSNLTTLEKLRLDSDVNKIVKKSGTWCTLPNLTEVDMADSDATDCDIHHLSCVTNLINLNLSECGALKGRALSDLTSLTNLTILDLSRNDNLNLKNIQPLSALTNLKKLDLSNCVGISPEALAGLTNLCGLPK